MSSGGSVAKMSEAKDRQTGVGAVTDVATHD